MRGGQAPGKAVAAKRAWRIPGKRLAASRAIMIFKDIYIESVMNILD
jgi:hypothetical protein